ncbi:MAG: NADP-dependent oxidoreductase [Steroidobacteraceae bacterium]
MRAVVFDDYGAPEVLRLREVDTPSAGAGQILIRIAAAAVNPADVKWRAGMFRGHAPIVFPHILGYDVAGTIESVGAGVTDFARGDRVAAMLDTRSKGGYAEFVAIAAHAAAKIPVDLNFPIAAAIPCAGLTGVQIIEESIQPKRGETVLITGATGAVGRFGLFAAIRRGVRVVAGVRASHAAEALALGAAQVVILGAEDSTGPPFDHVFDTVGGPAVARLCRHLAPGGLIRTAATTPIDPEGLSTQPVFVPLHQDCQGLRALAEDVAAHRIPVPIARRMPLEAAIEAHRLLEAGGLGGKIILEP